MPNGRVILCGAVRDRQLPAGDPEPVRLRRWGPKPDVRLVIQEVRQALYREVEPAFLDLLDIATFVYCADQAVGRGGLGLRAGQPVGDGWRRTLFFRIAVRNPALWTSRPILDELV